MKIVFYGRKRKPVYEFICRLPNEDRAKILACLKSVEELGLDSPRVIFRQIDRKLSEIKIRCVSGGFRIFYTMIKDNTLILLHAFQKKTQKSPKTEIKVAEKRRLETIEDESFYTR